MSETEMEITRVDLDFQEILNRGREDYGAIYQDFDSDLTDLDEAEEADSDSELTDLEDLELEKGM